MTKIYKKLTADQKARGVIFSSCLVYNKHSDDLSEGIHEVLTTQPIREAERMIERLKNDSFFDASPYKYNVIRQ